MAQRIIVYWRDIPAQVIVRQGRTMEKRELPEQFIQAIDASAMAAGAQDSETYMSQWRRGEAETCGGDLATEADRLRAELIARFDVPRLKAMIANGGRDTQTASA